MTSVLSQLPEDSAKSPVDGVDPSEAVLKDPNCFVEDPHLVLHSVRGVPRFDVAILAKLEGFPDYWIIATSGHRCTPFWTHPIRELWVQAGGEFTLERVQNQLPPMPEGHPDHYHVHDILKGRANKPKPYRGEKVELDLSQLEF